MQSQPAAPDGPLVLEHDEYSRAVITMQIAMILGWAAIGSVFALAVRPTVLRYAAATELPTRPPPLGVSEAMTAALFAAFAYRFGSSLETLAYSSLCWLGVPLAMTDLIARKLPNTVLAAAYGAVAVVLGTDAVLNARGGSLVRAALVMIAVLGIHSVLYAVGAIAGGDLKLAGLLGAALGWLSWEAAWNGLALGWILGGILVGAVRITRRRTTNHGIPLGPFLLAGALLCVLSFGPPVGAP